MEGGLVLAVRRSNRRMLFISLLVLILVILFFVANRNYYYNAIYGPFPISHEQLRSISDLSKEKQLYVEVRGDTVLESGITQVNQQLDRYTQGVQSETTVGYYEYLVLPDKILVLYSSTQDTSLSRIGVLRPLPADLRKEIVDASEEDGDDWLLPVMLDATDYSTNAFIGLGVMVPATLLSIFFLSLALKRSLYPTKHPLYKAAEAEQRWLQQYQGTEIGSLVPTCDCCSYHKKVARSSYRKNVSYFFRREEATATGNYCLSCNSQIFLRYTLTRLVGTWWGIIGMMLGPVYVLLNMYNYSKTLWQIFHSS